MNEEQKKKTLGIAIGSLVCGCFFLIPFLGQLLGLAAIILGIFALVMISKNKQTLQGNGLAITGIVLGAISMIIAPLYIISTSVFLARHVGSSEKARLTVVKAEIESNIPTALKLYDLDNNSYPTTEEGLQALLEEPASAKNWNGPYLRKTPKDPWGNPYQYELLTDKGGNPREYRLSSSGPDGVGGSNDDITSTQNITGSRQAIKQIDEDQLRQDIMQAAQSFDIAIQSLRKSNGSLLVKGISKSSSNIFRFIDGLNEREIEVSVKYSRKLDDYKVEFEIECH